MKYIILSIVACLAGVFPAQAEIVREPLGYPVTVTKIVDGDTFGIDAKEWSPFPNLSWRIRIRGIDTPEKRSKCAAEKDAALRMQKVSELLITKAHKKVYLQAVGMDKYGGRFDAIVMLPNGKSLGDILIASGLARPYLGGKRLPWCDSYGKLRP